MVDTLRHRICECGDPKYRHRHVRMSVELPPDPAPLYPVPSGLVSRTYPESRYHAEVCPCGCSQYTPLGSTPDATW